MSHDSSNVHLWGGLVFHYIIFLEKMWDHIWSAIVLFFWKYTHTKISIRFMHSWQLFLGFVLAIRIFVLSHNVCWISGKLSINRAQLCCLKKNYPQIHRWLIVVTESVQGQVKVWKVKFVKVDKVNEWFCHALTH